jgi:hypothetical protein
MATKKVLFATRGGSEKGEKKGGWGEGERSIVAIEMFSIATWAWRPKGFQLP